jgi:3-isopropylmalate/(R)-2-methylmalate dehydratase small subunit
MEGGFRAVVSPRFGDIFRNNATKSGLVPVVVDPDFGEAMMRAVQANPALEVVVDVEAREVSAPEAGLRSSFPLDDFTRHRLLEGLDDIGLTLRHIDRIAAYEAARPSWMPQV